MKKVVQFSGGKDSIVCLHLFKDVDDVQALFTNTGGAFPHVEDFVSETCKEFGVPLIIARPENSVMDWQEVNGLAADIIPWDSTPFMQTMSKADFGATLIPYATCCAANIWTPMNQALLDNDIKYVIRGSKSCDSKVGVPDGYVDDNGIYYHSPLWNWTDEDVFEYISDHQIKLPDHYSISGDSDSLDCWCCTAYMGKTGAARVSYTKDRYPDFYDSLAPNIALVNTAVSNAVKYYAEGF